jgi:2'-5' RNA ligase
MGKLGEHGVTRVLEAARRAAEGSAPFAATLGEVGAFPNARRARVLWLGLSEGADALVTLAKALERALHGQGFDPADRPFTPHLTIGRVRRGDADWSARFAALAADPAHAWAPSFTVDRIRVVQSTLSPGGSIYQVRAEAALVA